jgi:glyoxylate/hydroxypyruvate reductase
MIRLFHVSGLGRVSMQRINVLSIQRISAEDRAKIEAVDPAVELTDAGGWYDGEIRETWPAFTTARYLAPGATGSGTREEGDRLLAEAEVILGGWPFPLDLRARAPRLKWFHQRPAGASNLLMGDLWGSRVVVTTSRGSGNTLAMAEYAVAGILHFAKGLHSAAVDRGAGVFDHRAYRPLLLEGKNCVRRWRLERQDGDAFPCGHPACESFLKHSWARQGSNLQTDR